MTGRELEKVAPSFSKILEFSVARGGSPLFNELGAPLETGEGAETSGLLIILSSVSSD